MRTFSFVTVTLACSWSVFAACSPPLTETQPEDTAAAATVRDATVPDGEGTDSGDARPGHAEPVGNNDAESDMDSTTPLDSSVLSDASSGDAGTADAAGIVDGGKFGADATTPDAGAGSNLKTLIASATITTTTVDAKEVTSPIRHGYGATSCPPGYETTLDGTVHTCYVKFDTTPRQISLSIGHYKDTGGVEWLCVNAAPSDPSAGICSVLTSKAGKTAISFKESSSQTHFAQHPLLAEPSPHVAFTLINFGGDADFSIELVGNAISGSAYYYFLSYESGTASCYWARFTFPIIGTLAPAP